MTEFLRHPVTIFNLLLAHHHHHFNVHFLPRSIKGMDGCFQQRKVDNQPLVLSHHKAVVYPWECWKEFLVTGCPSNKSRFPLE